MYKINLTDLKDQVLKVNVQYGGGCVHPHVFELVTDGIVNNEGVMDFTLLHKTHNDLCKALIVKDYYFDLGEVYQLKSSVLQYIQINGEGKVAL
ncbi:MAG: hypothetical protein LRY27_01120 [Chitinophagales bacterium]|nr:hypothetical protein [Chitinophagales bacterium]